MKIGSLEIPNNAVLAPIAGYSDVGMRVLSYRYGAALCHTEMVSAKGLVYGSDNTRSLLFTDPKEPYTAVQLFGRDPEFIGAAVKHPALGGFCLIDLNLGCPVQKIVRNGEGSALMKEPDTVYDIVRAAVNASEGRPITVKIRAGFAEGDRLAPVIAAAAEGAGAAAVTVHGRTREMFYSGKADRGIVKEVKERVSVPVFVNGDVFSKRDFDEAMELSLADGASLARGALGRPQIFAEIRGEAPDADPVELIAEHASLLAAYYPEKLVLNSMKAHSTHYFKTLPGAKDLRRRIFAAAALPEFYSVLSAVRGKNL